MGIVVNAIAPSVISTPMTRQVPDDVNAYLLSRIPMNRFGEPEEFASLALELCRNTYVNAQAFRLDAGVRFAAK